MAAEPVGREDELGSLHAFLDQRGAGGLAAIALEGEPGIGKSTLWRAAVEETRTRGWRVLSTKPSESERALAHVGLGDLFDGVLDDVLPELTAPQRRALEVALLVEDAAGASADPRALGVAVRSALQLLAEEQLIVAIDDLQWLDASSASALAFALRRLSEAPILLIWSRRLDGEAPAALESALEPDRVNRVEVGPLSVGAIHGIVRARLSRALPRPTLLRLHEVSGGNPFYALELARALGADAAVRDPTRPLPVPERLEELVSARLGAFAGPTREALVLASAHARLTVEELRRGGLEPSALDPALRDHVVEVADGALRFTHPLLASVLYQGLDANERRRAHRRLAKVVESSLARARHLALSTDRPAATLAAALERAAADAKSRGAPIVAAELGEHAVRLTPGDDRADLDRRTAETARAHLAAGVFERGRALAGELLARSSEGTERAEALVLMAEAEGENIQRAVALLREALGEAGAPPALQAATHQRLSLAVRFTDGLDAAERHAALATELAESLGDTALRAASLASLALIRFNAGRPDALRLAEEAQELARRDASSVHAADADFALAHVLFWSCELDRARHLLEGMVAAWSDRDERMAANAIWYLALVELRAGRLSLAGDYAEQARAVTAQYMRDEEETPQTLFPATLVAAHRGELERARQLAEAANRHAERHAAHLRAPLATLATTAFWSGDAEAAASGFDAVERVTNPADVGEPSMSWWRAEQVEALLELGRVDDAVERLDAWEADGRRLGRRWVVAHATRCRGLAAAAQGDLERALALLGEAVADHEAAGDPFGRARALLALGITRRRARQKRPAREALEAAASGFEEMGAVAWAERARREVGSVGGRTRSEDLTAAEQRVADLVAQGRTNAEVAAALFLSQRTVASHLTHVYSKLGVRSRTELARRLG